MPLCEPRLVDQRITETHIIKVRKLLVPKTVFRSYSLYCYSLVSTTLQATAFYKVCVHFFFPVRDVSMSSPAECLFLLIIDASIPLDLREKNEKVIYSDQFRILCIIPIRPTPLYGLVRMHTDIFAFTIQFLKSSYQQHSKRGHYVHRSLRYRC
jgi:hypothetical protein